jgi:hypothetical protein
MLKGLLSHMLTLGLFQISLAAKTHRTANNNNSNNPIKLLYNNNDNC